MPRLARLLSLLVLAMLAVGCSAAPNHPAGTPTTSTTSAPGTGRTSAAPLCGFLHGSPTTTKFMVVFEENASYSSVIGSAAAPNFNTFARSCGLATDYTSLVHPSLPNYLEATSGLDFASSPWTTDCQASSPGCQTTASSIFSQTAGWKGYAESMPSNCETSNASTGTGQYYSRHNPAVYYVAAARRCASRDVPLGTLTRGALHDDVVHGTLPAFSTVTPNGNNDGHDSDVATADAWIGPWMKEITGGPDYRSGRLAVEIVWDEGEGSQRIASIWLSGWIRPGSTSAAPFTHFSTLRTAEEIAHLPFLGGASTAKDPRPAFGF